ncbi:MAG: tetratricopeptide repeat protein [Sphingomonas sp.]|uniref:tetratricopeptide repeat protein n=1 Tax=Sphingomonas sp. TaxID=28214 RepID=UPI00120F58AB|nr:tetratricopeptide repeat protein [Sphingomonas sp.]THD35037.1 MAG: tetratricopeptide repeat protein [Sphingomonas sp.]
MLPLLLYGGSILCQVACVVHCIRLGRNQFWIWPLIFFPVVGCLAYFIIEVLPGMQGNRHVRVMKAQAAKAIDPEREVRNARDALGLADTIANRIRLADALAAVHRPGEAIPLYREALAAQPMADPRTETKLANALFEDDQVDAALATVEDIKEPSGQSERDKLNLLRARLYDHVGRQDEALAIYRDIVTRMPGEEARCRYAALLIELGRKREALGVLEEVEDRMKRLDSYQRRDDAEMYRWAVDKLRELRAG